MENRLQSVSDIMARYQCSAPTARKLMRQMRHMNVSGLKVWLFDVLDWERQKTVDPEDKRSTVKPQRISQGTDYRIPRRREGTG